MTKSKQNRVPIPAPVRQQLWIAAAGRCEVNKCNKPVGIDFLTGKSINLGELAHIVADSPSGTRGDPVRSKLLAKDEANLLLACRECHKLIDDVFAVEDYPEALLKRWKTEHEARARSIYDAETAAISLPIIMSLPIATHSPVVSVREVNRAILKNSDYSVHPSQDPVQIGWSDLGVTDRDPDFWPIAERALTNKFETVIAPRLMGQNAASHLSIAAFAPIPMLMKLGSLVGDKIRANVLDLPNNRWLWRTDDEAKQTGDDWFHFDVPEVLPKRVFVAIEISNNASDFDKVVGTTPLVRFSAVNPRRELIGSEVNLSGFRRAFDSFINELQAAGARQLELLPVTSLCTSVEIGRRILPKIFEEVAVWEYRSSTWTWSLRIVGSS